MGVRTGRNFSLFVATADFFRVFSGQYRPGRPSRG
jgi:hypothetical protein